MSAGHLRGSVVVRAVRLLGGVALVVAIGAVGVGLVVARDESATGDVGAARAKRRAPELEGEVLVPPPVRLASLRGQLVVVNFWASWCQSTVINFWASWCIPCRDEAPVLAASARAHAGRVVFLGVDVQDLASDAQAFLREFDVPYVSVRDVGNSTYEDYGLTGVPETYYLDRDGRIVAHSPGAVSRRMLEHSVAAAIRGRR